MSLPRLAVHQVVLMNLLFIVSIIAGVIVLNRLPVDVYPDTSLDLAEITTPYIGASSEEVERLVTRKIEEEIEDVLGRDRIVSYSQPDVSVVTVKFREDMTPQEYEAAFGDLRTRLDRVADLPDDAEEPRLERLTTDEVMPLLQLGVYSTDDSNGEQILHRVAIDVRDQMRQLPGVKRVRAIGLREREIHIQIDKDQLEKHNLSLRRVAEIVQASNLNMPAGNLELGGTEITIRGVGEMEEPEDFGDLCIVRSPTGAHVHVRDVATIKQTFERAVWTARVNGRPAIMLTVSKDRGSNSLEIRETIGKFIDHYMDNLDIDGVRLEIQNDSTAIIASRLGVLKNNMIVGIAMVFAVLWFAVGFRNSMLAIVGIPFSFLCAVIFMYMIGVSLNAVSVFSLVLVSGMIVDDAIVVLENIYHHIQQGMPLREAVVFGTEEVIWPVFSSSLTTVVAFLPMLVMTGVLGRFFSIVPKTVTVALGASLFECILILPVHYLDWGPRPKKAKLNSGIPDAGAGKSSDFGIPSLSNARGWRARFMAWYDVVLGQALAYRIMGPVLILACALFVWQAQRTLTVEMFPSDFPTFVVDIDNRPGASLAATAKEVEAFAEVINEFTPDPIVRSAAAVGVQVTDDGMRNMRPDIAQMWVDVSPDSPAARDPVDVINNVRAALAKYAEDHPERTVEEIRAWPVRDGPPVGKPVAIRVEHPDYDVAREIVDQIKERLRHLPGVSEVADNLQLGNRELQLVVNDDRASEHGVTFLDVATALRGATDGLTVGEFKDTQHDEDLDIKVRYAPEFVDRLDQLTDIDVVSAVTGETMKLHQVADLVFDRSYTNRYHYDTKRAVEVTASIDSHVTDAQIVNNRILEEFGPLANGDDKLNIVAGGQFAETQASFESLWQSAAIALCLMYLVLASQFRNYMQPLVVMTAVLFGVMGMVIGLVVNDYPFSVVTGIAMVGLSGVVVNDALVLIDFINVQRRDGLPLARAIHVACHRRFRPIILTTVTTTVGLAPMALGLGGYSKIWSPFAMSMCWGLIFATALTLLVVPALYYLVEDARGFFGRLRPGRRAIVDAAEHSAV
jgi:multidrug efflux pump subunit AcrB